MGLWSSVSHVVGGAVHTITSPVAKVVGYVGNGIKTAGNAVVHTVGSGVSAIGSGAKAVGNGVATAAGAVYHKAETVTNTVYKDAVSLAHAPIDLAGKTLDKGFDLLSSPLLLLGAAAIGVSFMMSRK